MPAIELGVAFGRGEDHLRSMSADVPSATVYGKVALSVRLDAAQAERLRAVASAANVSLTTYIEAVLADDLVMHDPVAGVIAMRSVPGLPGEIDPETVLRGPDESDAGYAKRREVVGGLWSLPDAG